VFLDARVVWGDATLGEAAIAAARTALRGRETARHQLAAAVLEWRAPRGPFGGIRPDDARTGTIDLKLALVHAAGFARITALVHGIAATGTGARLRALAEGGALPRDAAAEALAAWRFLLGLRLAARTRDGDGGDHIDPTALSAWDRALLKRALANIDALRERLRR
jgi:CBS domain-containing protein